MVHNPVQFQSYLFSSNNLTRLTAAMPSQWRIGVATLGVIIAVGLAYRNRESICSFFYSKPKNLEAGPKKGSNRTDANGTQKPPLGLNTTPPTPSNSSTISPNLINPTTTAAPSTINPAKVDYATDQIKNLSFTIAKKIFEQNPGKSVSVCPYSIILLLGMVGHALPAGERQKFLKVFKCEAIAECDFNEAMQNLQNEFKIIQNNINKLNNRKAAFDKKEHTGTETEQTHDFRKILYPTTDVKGISLANAVVSSQPIADPTYEKEIQTLFQAKFIQAEADELAQAVNKFLDESTNGQIKDLIKGRLALCIVNAVAFELEWLNKFDVTLTQPSSFTTSGGDIIRVEMMHMKFNPPGAFNMRVVQAGIRVQEFDTYEAAVFPYFGSPEDILKIEDEDEVACYLENNQLTEGSFQKLYQLVILPKGSHTVESVMQQFSDLTVLQDVAQKTRAHFSDRALMIEMPKLSIKSTVEEQNLKAVFNDLGFPPAIPEKICNPAPELSFQHVVHFEQNEVGSKGAAATTAVGKGSVKNFKLNRPFAYFIMFDKSTVIAQGTAQDQTALVTG